MHDPIDGSDAWCMAPADPGVLYAWTACDRQGRGACGVTDEPGRASRHVRSTLSTLSPDTDASGEVRRVRLDRSARQPAYLYGRVVARFSARRGAVTRLYGGEAL